MWETLTEGEFNLVANVLQTPTHHYVVVPVSGLKAGDVCPEKVRFVMGKNFCSFSLSVDIPEWVPTEETSAPSRTGTFRHFGVSSS